MRVGYVLKRFPRVSETFIGQEILGLERHGIDVEVFALRPNDSKVAHAWLKELAAPVHTFESMGFSNTWRRLQTLARQSEAGRRAAHDAILSAFDHPTRSGRRYLEEACWIAGLARELEVDHLHAHFANHPAFVAMLAHMLMAKGFSFTAHAKDIYRDGPPADLWRQQVERADFTVTVCRANRAHLGGILSPAVIAKVETLYNGVDTTRIRPRATAAVSGDSTVLCVGRLIEKKGIDVLVEASPAILSQHPEARIVVVGEGDQRADLERRVAGLGLAGRFQLLGELAHDEVIELMTRSRVFVLPCRIAADGDRDALPTVLLEAMASALACVSTAVSGVPEIIAEGRTGLIVPPNDPASLAGAVSEILHDAERCHRMGQAGRQRVEQRFDLINSSGRLAELFEGSSSSRPTRRGSVVRLPTVAEGR